jgi:hypothetical protein
MQQNHLCVYLSALYVVTPDVDGQFLNLSAERLAHNSGNDQISKRMSWVSYHKERLVTTETEELLFIRIWNYYETDRTSSDQPALYEQPHKHVCSSVNTQLQFTISPTLSTVHSTEHQPSQRRPKNWNSTVWSYDDERKAPNLCVCGSRMARFYLSFN